MNCFLHYFSLLLFASLCFLFSCQVDPEVPGPPSGPEPPAIEIDPNQASEFLLFMDAQEIQGSLPSAPNGRMYMNVEDTIYSIKGYPFGNRIRFQKSASQDVSGYYVGIPGASVYYDVPEEYQEGQYVPEGEDDTTSVLFSGTRS